MYLWLLVLYIEEISSSFYQGVQFAGDLAVMASETSLLASNLLFQCIHDSYVISQTTTVTHIFCI